MQAVAGLKLGPFAVKKKTRQNQMNKKNISNHEAMSDGKVPGSHVVEDARDKERADAAQLALGKGARCRRDVVNGAHGNANRDARGFLTDEISGTLGIPLCHGQGLLRRQGRKLDGTRNVVTPLLAIGEHLNERKMLSSNLTYLNKSG